MKRLYISLYLFFCSFSFAFSQCVLTVLPQTNEGCVITRSEATFTDLVNTQTTGNKIVKTSSTNNWDAGAFSVGSVWNGGMAETKITQTNKNRIFGLSATNIPSQNGINSVEYAIVFRSWGAAEIQQSGSYMSNLGNYAIGDIFKIAIENNAVIYYKNGAVVYQSTIVPTLPLHVDLVFEHSGAEISDVYITNNSGGYFEAVPSAGMNVSEYEWFVNGVQHSETGATFALTDFSDDDVLDCIAKLAPGCGTPQLSSNRSVLTVNPNPTLPSLVITPLHATESCYSAVDSVVWEANNPENVKVRGAEVEKMQGYNTSNGGVYSLNKVYNNGYFEFQTHENNKRKMMGLSTQDQGSHESSIEYAFYFEGSSLSVYERGSWKAGLGNYTVNDVFKISIEDEIVKFYKNNELKYMSSTTPNLPLIADGTMQEIGSTFIKAYFSNPSNGMFSVIDGLPTGAEAQWLVNDLPTDQEGSIAQFEGLSENDVVQCRFFSWLAGCGEVEIFSNPIRILPINRNAFSRFYIEGNYESAGTEMAEETVVWNPAKLVNVACVNNEIENVGGNGSNDAGASSLNTVKNGGYFAYYVDETNKTKMIGLSKTDPNVNINSTQFGMQLQNGKITIIESGQWGPGNFNFSVGDVLKIAIESNVVKYYRNSTLLYTSSVTPSPPLLVDVSFSTKNGTVKKARVGNKNLRKFTAHANGLGSSPKFTWFINDMPIFENNASVYLSDVEYGDVITCSVIPEIQGCGRYNQVISNEILYLGRGESSHWTGSVSNQWHDPANWTDGVPNEHLSAVIPAGTPFEPIITLSQSVKTLRIYPTANVTLSGTVELDVYGNFIKDGNFNPGSGNVYFSGNEIQSVKGSVIFHDIGIRKPDGYVNLLNDIRIEGRADLIRGKIHTQENAVYFSEHGISSSGSSESYIHGNVIREGAGDFFYPVGDERHYAPILLRPEDQDVNTIKVQYHHINPHYRGYNVHQVDDNIYEVSHCEYWEITRESGNSPIRATLSYEEERSCEIDDLHFIQVVAWIADTWGSLGLSNLSTSNDYLDVDAQQLTSENTVYSLGILSGYTPLPVEWIYFEAKKSGSAVNLEWETMTETNNSHFTIERSNNTVDFKPIGKINAVGESRTPITYRHTDLHPEIGINYYRLSQTDFDGSKKYFDIRSVWFDGSSDYTIYPNPASNKLTIEGNSIQESLISIFDMTGKTIRTFKVDNSSIQIDVSSLTRGMYLLKIENGEQWSFEKIVIE